MLLRLVFLLAVVAYTQASENVDELASAKVVFLIDVADLSKEERKNVLTFTESVATDAAKKGANVGFVLAEDDFITDQNDFDSWNLERRLDRIHLYVDQVDKAWQRRETMLKPQHVSTLADSLSLLERRLSFMKNVDKMVTFVVTGAKEVNFLKTAKLFMDLQAKFNIKFGAVIIGDSLSTDDFAAVTGSPCLTTRFLTTEKLVQDLREVTKVSVLLRRLLKGVDNIDDEELLCQSIDSEVEVEFSKRFAGESTDKQTSIRSEAPEPMNVPSASSPSNDEGAVNDKAAKKNQGEETDREEIEKAEQARQRQIQLEEAERRRDLQREDEGRRKLEAINKYEKADSIRAEKVKEDKKMVEDHQVVDSTKKEQLVCYRCDGCSETALDDQAIMTCGDADMQSCFTARIGFGNDVVWVRGCELKAKCINVTAPVLTRTCCSGNMCNGLAPTTPKPKKTTTKKTTTQKTTPTTTTTTTPKPTAPVVPAEWSQSRQPLDLTGGAHPFADVEVYFLVDFAGLSGSDEVEVVASAKRLAIEAAILGAEVSVVNGNRIRRVSPYQIHLAFENSKKRPTKEDVFKRFEQELHLEPEKLKQKVRIHQYHTTTPAPNVTSTIPATFDHLIEKLLNRQDRSDANARQDIFIVFLTGADMPRLAATSIWESHERLARLNPHYLTLMIGNLTSPESFVELAENSDNPRCMVLRFATTAKLASVETDLSRLLVEAVDYVRAHDTLLTFRCFDEPATPSAVSRANKKRPKTKSTTSTTTSTTTTTTEAASSSTAKTYEPTTTKETRVSAEQPAVYVSKPKDHETVVLVQEPVEESKVEQDNKQEKPEQKAPLVVEIDVVDKSGERIDKVVVIPSKISQTNEEDRQTEDKAEHHQRHAHHHTKNNEKEHVHSESRVLRHKKDSQHGEAEAEEREFSAKNTKHHEHHKKPEPEADDEPASRRVVVVVEDPNAESSKKPANVKSGVEEDLVDKKLKKMETIIHNVEADKKDSKKDEDLTVVVIEEKPVADVKTVVKKAVESAKARNETSKKDNSGKLMCYECEGCTAARPAPTSIVACGDGDIASPHRGVCFIQRVGDKYTRGCIEGYECLETNSDVLTQFCCNSHSLCNDILPSSISPVDPTSATGGKKVASSAGAVSFSLAVLMVALII